jgi:hypothetical protein
MSDKDEKIQELERKLARTQELLESSMVITSKIQSENLELLGRVRSALLGIETISGNDWGVRFYSLLRCMVCCVDNEHAWRIIREFISYEKTKNTPLATPQKIITIDKIIEKIKSELNII